jgi:hypothetical protein
LHAKIHIYSYKKEQRKVTGEERRAKEGDKEKKGECGKALPV